MYAVKCSVRFVTVHIPNKTSIKYVSNAQFQSLFTKLIEFEKYVNDVKASLRYEKAKGPIPEDCEVKSVQKYQSNTPTMLSPKPFKPRQPSGKRSKYSLNFGEENLQWARSGLSTKLDKNITGKKERAPRLYTTNEKTSKKESSCSIIIDCSLVGEHNKHNLTVFKNKENSKMFSPPISRKFYSTNYNSLKMSYINNLVSVINAYEVDSFPATQCRLNMSTSCRVMREAIPALFTSNIEKPTKIRNYCGKKLIPLSEKNDSFDILNNFHIRNFRMNMATSSDTLTNEDSYPKNIEQPAQVSPPISVHASVERINKLKKELQNEESVLKDLIKSDSTSKTPAFIQQENKSILSNAPCSRVSKITTEKVIGFCAK